MRTSSGVRYRYYVSHALLQNGKEEAGSVTRVPAPEIEPLVLDGVRRHIETTDLPGGAADRGMIERHVDRVIVRRSGSSPPSIIACVQNCTFGPAVLP